MYDACSSVGLKADFLDNVVEFAEPVYLPKDKLWVRFGRQQSLHTQDQQSPRHSLFNFEQLMQSTGVYPWRFD